MCDCSICSNTPGTFHRAFHKNSTSTMEHCGASTYIGSRIARLTGTYVTNDLFKQGEAASVLYIKCCTNACRRSSRRSLRLRSVCYHLSHGVTSLLHTMRRGINVSGTLFFVASANCSSTYVPSGGCFALPANRLGVSHYITLLGVCLNTLCNGSGCIRNSCLGRLCLGRTLVRGHRLGVGRLLSHYARFLSRVTNIGHICPSLSLLSNSTSTTVHGDCGTRHSNSLVLRISPK